MKKNKNVSASLVVHEIGDCLKRTLQWCTEHFEEINVVDSGESTDNTTAICNEFNNQINLYTRPFDNFQNQTNFILDKSTKPWICGLDGDEIIYSPWSMDQVVKLLDKESRTIGILDRINFQKDIYHRRTPIQPDYQTGRLFQGHKRATGAMHSLIDLSNENSMLIPKIIMLHWGHIRSNECLLKKTQIYKKFVNIDNADGKNVEKYDDWFVRRNKEWNKNIVRIDDNNLIKYIEKWNAIK
jgi:glycosyltransferase involved in cell wall biosynthesis